ncbi:ABC transporter substrate-binding protein [Arcticibacterium luteifluviistationis]|uniref:ABC transporter substrate-binding protein n=1 Tax=Arcticibacterium luteifluviistationis TaxID=1784714 RepID=A0A2Z4G6H0_9BACT|nr:extracellular solute-binding protein [Arcticibacterium luteifluviistationis]AWV96739.1 ABC transporter substrate-binding protein [Arcticibacterium luteifluviistationis]
MDQKIILRGITWNHSRGISPLQATSQRFTELNPNVEIIWDKRSLQAFADEPIDKLAERYDFLIIDHPWAGFAAKNKVILPLNQHLPKAFIQDLKENSVGHSFESYTFNNDVWALAIDAATPVAASRPDLFAKLGLEIPNTFEELVSLSKKGGVIMPGIPQDTLMNFYMFCCNLGEEVCVSKDEVVSEHIGIKALQMLRMLAVNMPTEIWDWNPIKVYEALSKGDSYYYSPWAYGYANYSRKGYAEHLLDFHDIVDIEGTNGISTLGGTGLAISAKTAHLDTALKYAQMVGSPTCQETVYFESGGQPGHRKAWESEHTNSLANNYFKNTLPTLDRAFLRPRYAGHMYFQDRAGAPIREYLMNGGDEKKILTKLNQVYLKSLEI